MDPTGAGNVPETAFLIMRSVDGGNTYQILKRVPVGQTTYTDAGLSPNTYYYKVLSTNNFANSASTAPVPALIPTPPAHPTNGLAVAVSTAEIDLSWTNNATNALGYQIFQRIGSGGLYTLLVTLPPTATSYVVQNPLPNTLYNYHIVAFNISGHNDFIGATVTTPNVGGSFLGTDTVTQGSWKGTYGSDGYNVAGDSSSYPSYATVSFTGSSSFVWASPTTDPRALQHPAASGQIAATAFGTSFTVDINLTDGQAHNVALYLLDWENAGRVERVDLIDVSTGIVDRTQTISKFVNGVYLYWNIVGHVQFRFTVVQGGNAVLSGLFFGLVPAAPAMITDPTTQGNWQGTYGADGYSMAGASDSFPAYAQVSVISGEPLTAARATFEPYTWSLSSTDPRNLTLPNGTGKIAATWEDPSTIITNLVLQDEQSHLVTMYFLDWDNQSRNEQVNVYAYDPIADVRGALINSQTLANFSNGIYLSWNVRGAVQFDIVNLLTNPASNCVMSAIFFGGATPTATYLNSDLATQGSWKGTYGADGYTIAGGSSSYPTYASVGTTGITAFTWAGSTTDPCALLLPTGSNNVASAFFANTSFTVDINLLDGQAHGVALYLLDWDNAGRKEQVNILNAVTGTVLNSQTVSNFSQGVYLDWSLRGHIQIQITSLNATNAVLSGLFFGTVPAAAYVGNDAATQATWKGVYGNDGFNVIGDSANYPAYAQVSTAGIPGFTWAAATTDPRA